MYFKHLYVFRMYVVYLQIKFYGRQILSTKNSQVCVNRLAKTSVSDYKCTTVVQQLRAQIHDVFFRQCIGVFISFSYKIFFCKIESFASLSLYGVIGKGVQVNFFI